MGEASEPLLDARDIQGNIVPGFVRAQQFFAAFAADDADALRNALRSLPQLTTLETALGHRDDRRASLAQGMGRPAREDLWLNLGLSARATDLLGAAGVRDLDAWFSRGMTPGQMGDPTQPSLPDGSANPAHRNHWLIGSPDKPCDVLLIFAHDTDVQTLAAPVVDRFAQLLGAAPNHVDLCELQDGETEHFGFRDGISQPGVYGRVVADGAERLLTTRYGVPPQQGIEFGKPGQPLVWPGQFLTGQPTFAGEVVELAPELSNGSFLVLRRLQQDVSTFLADTEAMAAALSGQSPAPLSGDELRTRIVGRHPSGASLMRDEQGAQPVDGLLAINYFGFRAPLPALMLSDGTRVSASEADRDVLRGRRCPIWAHTRKVNPRELGTDRGGEHETLGFQMLRRGIPFGPAYNRLMPHAPENDVARGLMFVSYQRQIENQFGVLNRGWMNNRDAPSGGGFDLLVGQRIDTATGLHDAKSATYFAASADPETPGVEFEAPHQWVIPTGGAFLFAPSIGFIERFVRAQSGG